MKKFQKTGFAVLDVINRHPRVPSGIKWGMIALTEQLGSKPVDIMRALTWLRGIGAVEESNGEILLTDFGREMVESNG